VGSRGFTGRLPSSLKRRIPALRERDALRNEVHQLRAQLSELEELHKLREQVGWLERRLDYERLFPAEWADRRVRDRFGLKVRQGPFAGMTYPDWALGTTDQLAPKLLGIYEHEVYGAVERMIARSPELVMNIGAADGYYAVGLARRLPDAQVLAFDIDEERLERLTGLAELNGVADRVEVVAAACDYETFERRLGKRSAIMCDIDGGEKELLRPDRAPSLRRAALLVEVHDRAAPGTSNSLREAFGNSHEISEFRAVPRRIADFPDLDFMPWVTRLLAIDEFRDDDGLWFEMTPRA
jgi:hypothetical protein